MSDHTAADNFGLPINRKVELFSKPTLNPVLSQLLSEMNGDSEESTKAAPEGDEALIKEEITLSDDFFFMDKDDEDKPSKAYINFRNRLFGPGSKVVKVEVTRASGRIVAIAIHQDTAASKQDEVIFYIIQALLMP